MTVQAVPAPASRPASAWQGPSSSSLQSAPKISEPVVNRSRATPEPAAKPAPAAAASLRVTEPVAEAEVPKLALSTLAPQQWIDLFHQLPLSGVARNIAANSVLQEVTGARLKLLLEDGKATLYNDEHRKRIEGVLAEYFGATVELRVDIGVPSGETPAAWRQRREAERKEAARKAFTEDALVCALVERFGAEIQLDSITALASDKLH